MKGTTALVMCLVVAMVVIAQSSVSAFSLVAGVDATSIGQSIIGGQTTKIPVIEADFDIAYGPTKSGPAIGVNKDKDPNVLVGRPVYTPYAEWLFIPMKFRSHDQLLNLVPAISIDGRSANEEWGWDCERKRIFIHTSCLLDRTNDNILNIELVATTEGRRDNRFLFIRWANKFDVPRAFAVKLVFFDPVKSNALSAFGWLETEAKMSCGRAWSALGAQEKAMLAQKYINEHVPAFFLTSGHLLSIYEALTGGFAQTETSAPPSRSFWFNVTNFLEGDCVYLYRDGEREPIDSWSLQVKDLVEIPVNGRTVMVVRHPLNLAPGNYLIRFVNTDSRIAQMQKRFTVYASGNHDKVIDIARPR